MHALLIEDEILLVLMMEDLLAELGFRSFQSAATASDAIDAARQRKPDLIASDCRLREGTGPEAVAAILAEQIVPVIFTTGHADLIRGLVPWPVLSKPVNRHMLQRAFNEAQNIRDRMLGGVEPAFASPPRIAHAEILGL